MGAYELKDFDGTNWEIVYQLADAAIPFDQAGNHQTIDRRRFFDTDHFARRHYNVCEISTGKIVGYGAVEQQADDSFRMFILLHSGEMWDSAGDMLYRQLLSDLNNLNARLVWWREYANDLALLHFVNAREFIETDQVIDLRAPLTTDASTLIANGFQPTVHSDYQQIIIQSTQKDMLELAENSGFQRVFAYVRLQKSLAS